MEKVIKFLQEILNEEITFENDSKLICEKFDIMVCIDDINLIKESIDSKPNENLALINSNNYEVAVKIESWRKMPISLMLGNNGYLEMRENSAGIVYSISPLSLE